MSRTNWNKTKDLIYRAAGRALPHLFVLCAAMAFARGNDALGYVYFMALAMWCCKEEL